LGLFLEEQDPWEAFLGAQLPTGGDGIVNGDGDGETCRAETYADEIVD
jgi:hypothetical protein